MPLFNCNQKKQHIRYRIHSCNIRPHKVRFACQGNTYSKNKTQVPAYKTAQSQVRWSGTHVHTQHKSLPTRPHRVRFAGQGHTYTHNTSPCLQDRTESGSRVRDTRTHTTQVPAYKTAQSQVRGSGTHVHTQHKSLPTRPHRVRFAGQGHTYTHNTSPCLQDRTESGSLVRGTRTHTTQVPAYKTAQSQVRRSGTHVHTQHKSLPTRPHRVRFAGQGHTYTHNTSPCLQDRTESGSPVRDTHTHTTQVPAYKTAQGQVRGSGTHVHTQHKSLPTRPHRVRFAGQGHTYTHNTSPCLQDRTESGSPVRDTRTHTTQVPARKTAQSQVRVSGTHVHTQHKSLPTRPHRVGSPVRDTRTHTTQVPAYKTAQSQVRRSGTHVHTQHKSLPTRPHRVRFAGQGHTYTHNTSPCLQDRTESGSLVRGKRTHTTQVPAYKTAQSQVRGSGTHVHTQHKSLPTRPHRVRFAGQGHTYTHNTSPCLQDRTESGSLVRGTRTHTTQVPAYKTAQSQVRRSGTHVHTQHKSLPTRPHRVRFASQGHTYTHNTSPCPQDCTKSGSRVRDTRTHTTQVPAYKTAQSQVRRSGTHVHTQHKSLPTRPHRVRFAGQGHTYTHNTSPCLQDRTESGSPVRDTRTHTTQVPAYKTAQSQVRWSGANVHTQHKSLPTRPHRVRFAGQGHTYTHNTSPCLQDRTESGSPVRDTRTHTTQVPAHKTAQIQVHVSGTHVHTQHKSLPTRPHRVRFAGQGHTYTHNTSPCLQDRTESGSPVRDTRTHTTQVPAYKTAQSQVRRSGTHVHTQHKSLPTRPHRVRFAGQGHTYTHNTSPCLQDRTESGLLVRDTRTHTTQIPAYKTAQSQVHWSGAHVHTQHKSLPTRPHRVRFASQGHTYTHNTSPCPQDCTKSGSRVRDTRTHTTQVPAYKTAKSQVRQSGTHVHTQHKSLPTRPHRVRFAGQGHTYTHNTSPCLQDHTESGSPVRDTRTHTTQVPAYKTARSQVRRSGTHVHTQHKSLPTRPHRVRFAGQGHTYTHNTNPCLQDRTESGSPVRGTRTHTTQVPAYKTAQSQVRRSGTHVHTQHKSLPTRPHRVRFAGQGHTYAHNTNPCLQDRTESGSLVRDTRTHTTQVPAYKTAQSQVRGSGTHVHTQHKSLPTRPHRVGFAQRQIHHSGMYTHTDSILTCTLDNSDSILTLDNSDSRLRLQVLFDGCLAGVSSRNELDDRQSVVSGVIGQVLLLYTSCNN